MEKRKYLIKTLLDEQPRYKDMEIPEEAGKQKILYLELGVGYNTPGIIKYPFWQMTAKNPKAIYACVNFGEAICPEDISDQAICINGDIGAVIDSMLRNWIADEQTQWDYGEPSYETPEAVRELFDKKYVVS